MGTKRIKPGTRSALKAEQKVAFALLLFLGLGGAYFGFRSFGANLYRPIQIQFAKYYTGETNFSLRGDEDAKLEALKEKDTDLDGIMDYDELYIYKTSPYLTDSDSDGFDDKTEIFSGNDPNCPKGVTCRAVSETKAKTSAVEISQVPEPAPVTSESDTTGTDVSQLESPEQIKEFFKEASIDDIRSALKASGLSEAQINNIDDASLRKLFNQALEDATPQSGE